MNSEPGNRKASALVNHLLTILSELGLEILLQQVFMRVLPTHIQDALAGTNRVDEIMACPCHTMLTVCNVFILLLFFLPQLAHV